MKLPAALALAIFLLSSGIASARQAASPTDENAGVRKAIDSGNSQYISAFAKLDAAAAAAIFDDDGVRLSPKGTVFRGHTAIQKRTAGFMQSVTGPIKVTINTQDLWVVDDLAYETGKYSYTFTPAGEKETQLTGHYVTIWKKQKDGGWKIVSDMGVPNDQ